MKGETIEIWGNENRVKDMVYVKDFCQMMARALEVKTKNLVIIMWELE